MDSMWRKGEQTMSRWIDADALIADLDKGLWGKDYDKVLAEAIIREAPSIEIVRCKECRYFYTEERFGETVHFCKHFNDARGYWAKIYADDFCSYGQKGDENVETD